MPHTFVRVKRFAFALIAASGAACQSSTGAVEQVTSLDGVTVSARRSPDRRTVVVQLKNESATEILSSGVTAIEVFQDGRWTSQFGTNNVPPMSNPVPVGATESFTKDIDASLERVRVVIFVSRGGQQPTFLGRLTAVAEDTN
jgi:hypothetical protein